MQRSPILHSSLFFNQKVSLRLVIEWLRVLVDDDMKNRFLLDSRNGAILRKDCVWIENGCVEMSVVDQTT